MCGNKTKKCDDCNNYIKKKNWAEHAGSRECSIFREEAARKQMLEEQKRLEEIERFRKEEEEQRRMMQAKREKREREQQEELVRREREKEALNRMHQPRDKVPVSSVRAASGNKTRQEPGVATSSRVS